METEKLISELKRTIVKTRKQKYITEEIRIDLMASECLDKIQELQAEVEVLKTNVQYLEEGADEVNQANEDLQAELDRLKDRLVISPYGDDKIDELEEAIENVRFQKEQLQAEVDRLKHGWISVAERLPENTASVLAGNKDVIWTAFWFENAWHEPNGWVLNEITHWQPLPQPPEGT